MVKIIAKASNLQRKCHWDFFSFYVKATSFLSLTNMQTFRLVSLFGRLICFCSWTNFEGHRPFLTERLYKQWANCHLWHLSTKYPTLRPLSPLLTHYFQMLDFAYNIIAPKQWNMIATIFSGDSWSASSCMVRTSRFEVVGKRQKTGWNV